MKKLVLLSILLLFVSSAFAAVPSGDDDPVLQAMSAELKRSQEKLQLQQLQRPYYIEYSVIDNTDYTVEGTLGALRQDQQVRTRLLRVVVRIGDYSQDSYYGQGTGQVDILPTEDDPLALRHQLWLATDTAYKNALSAYTNKESLLKNLAEQTTPVPDFSKEEPFKLIGEMVAPDFDREQWRKAVRSISALFRQDPQIDNSQASFNYRGSNRYFMNTEGTVTRKGEKVYTFYLAGSTQASDGMRLTDSRDYVMATVEELPAVEKLTADARELIERLATLRKAPVVEDAYRGPVVFSPDAARVAFWTLVGPNVTGDRPQPGSTARTTGQYASHYKTRVLPEFITIVDDPTKTEFKGRKLAGSYEVDDEGVKAQAVTVVEKGKLINYLMGRTPIRDFTKSNGHGRSAPGAPPSSNFSNFFVQASETVSADDLVKRMLEMCKDQGLEYGYLVRSATLDLTPQLVYRVWVEDGRQELVRGAVFGEFDHRSLRNDIVAAGDDAAADNSNEPVAKAVISPSLLFGEVELRLSNASKQRLPQYPPPTLADARPIPVTADIPKERKKK